MKILLVANGYPNPYKPYAANYIRRHVLLQQKEGLKFSILAPLDSRRGVIRTFWKYLVLLPRFLQHLVIGNYDLVHAHWPIPAGVFGMLLSWRGKPFVLTSHGAFVDDYYSRPWVVRRLVKLVLQNADVIIAVGKQHKANIKNIVNRNDASIRQISMGVWSPEHILDQEDARKELNLPMDEKIIISIGNMEREKGLDILLRAVHILASDGVPFKLLIGGKGSQENNILKMIDEYQIQESVVMIGAIYPDDVFSWLSAADICVIPSRRESFGLVAVEAMASGTLVIGADVGGLSETINCGENGFLFPVEDYTSLANELRNVLKNDGCWKQLVQTGRETATTFDLRKQSMEVIEVYKNCLHLS